MDLFSLFPTMFQDVKDSYQNFLEKEVNAEMGGESHTFKAEEPPHVLFSSSKRKPPRGCPMWRFRGSGGSNTADSMDSAPEASSHSSRGRSTNGEGGIQIVDEEFWDSLIFDETTIAI